MKSTDLPKLYDGYREPEIVVDVPRAWIVQDEEALDGQWKTALRTGSQVEVSEKFFTIFKLASLESKFHLIDRFKTESGIQIEEGPR